MKHDCGLTGNNVESLWWVKHCQSAKRLPPEVHRELCILMATPGFAEGYWAYAFGRTRLWAKHFRKSVNLADYQTEALENWESITRDDALILASLRSTRGSLPVKCAIYLAEDMKQGLSWSKARKTWGVGEQVLHDVTDFGPFGRNIATLPDWFRKLILV